MKSNLQKRVEKARQLRFTPVKDNKKEWNTWGSKDDHYVVSLHSQSVMIYNGEEYKITAFFTGCHKHTVDTNNPYVIDINECQGNNQHTVCYHCLGKIINAYSNTDKMLEFYETYQQTCDMAVYKNGDKLVKIFNGNCEGVVWLLVRESVNNWPITSEILSVRDNVNLMRGPEEEGID